MYIKKKKTPRNVKRLKTNYCPENRLQNYIQNDRKSLKSHNITATTS